MVFDLSILICHTDNPMRNIMLNALEAEFDRQIRENGLEGRVEILVDHDSGTIGAKRNRLLDKAWGKYSAFFDDDDFPFPNYLKDVFEGIEKGVDCCSMRGLITFNGEDGEIFEHSIKYKEWATTTNPIKYERGINHLNVIKSEITKQIKFPEINHGEDKIWSDNLRDSGLIKTEHYINQPIYHYRYVSNKNY